uniref:Methyltransferase n=1 Tax=Populus trichocarpa TaxID=3694 RepID=B9HDY3_POPTR
MLDNRHCKSWSLVFERSAKPSQTITSSRIKKGDLLVVDCLEPPTCLVPLPGGYKRPIEWPASREKIWYHNVPHTKLAQIKGHQDWVKVTGEFLTFPSDGTQFKHGALHYIDFIN